MENAKTLVQRVKTSIVAEVDAHKALIVVGSCTHEEYKKHCGLVSGLEAALDVLDMEYEKLRRGHDDTGLDDDQ